VVGNVVENINRCIDANYYPLDVRDKLGNLVSPGGDRINNMKHRPIGIGASGFAEVLYKLDLHFTHPLIFKLNKMIFACIYFNAMARSIQLSVWDGPYTSFEGSKLSEGKFQFDLWKDEFQSLKTQGLCPNGLRDEHDDDEIDPSEWGQMPISLLSAPREYSGNDIVYVVGIIQPSWNSLRENLLKFKARNSLMMASMPTASTAQILRNTESMEAPTSNIYVRKVLKGSYSVINRYMIRDLKEIDLWTDDTLEFIRVNNGSLQSIDRWFNESGRYPTLSDRQNERVIYIMQKYQTQWELSQKHMLKLIADRGRYICQSQSTNIFVDGATDQELEAILISSWYYGNKTGVYYTRIKPPVEAVKSTVDVSVDKWVKENLLISVEKGLTTPTAHFNVLQDIHSTLSRKTKSTSRRDCDSNCLSCSA
jgi:ribonucleoside-diphosphate reductase alpha chain